MRLSRRSPEGQPLRTLGAQQAKERELRIKGRRSSVQPKLREPLSHVRQVWVFFKVCDESREVPSEVVLLRVRGLREGSVEHFSVSALGGKGDEGKRARGGRQLWRRRSRLGFLQRQSQGGGESREIWGLGNRRFRRQGGQWWQRCRLLCRHRSICVQCVRVW